jgi:predicted glycoside hydrolase/deacetylase ChbG (UPF0249 family)
LSAHERTVLIVNADDFGRTPSVNEGIVRSHEEGIVTSASLMVRWPSAREAARRSRELPGLSVGLHLDFGEAIWRGGRWVSVYTVVPLEAPAVRAEARRQLAEFRRLMRRDPTHLDTHQHAHVHEPKIVPELAELAEEVGVPLRERDGVRFEGGFFGQEGDGTPVDRAISAGGLRALIAEITPGVTELCCHPGAGRDPWSVYDRERALEVQTLCDPAVRLDIEERGIQLRSFAELDR